MKKTNAIIFNIIFQLSIALLILDFQANPQNLRPSCITANDSSGQLGSRQIIDCISCQSFKTKEISDPFIGYISILVPLSDSPAAGLNSRLPFDSSQIKNNNQEQFNYVANVYTQQGCERYECSSFHLLEDFKYKNKSNLEKLNQHNIQRNDATFQISNISITSLSYQLGIGYEQEAIVLETENLNQKEISSLMVRARYTVIDRVEGDQEPAILIYKLQTNIIVRFLLILVVLLESVKLYSLLSHYKTFVRNFIFFILIIGFLSSKTAILSSTLAIYLTIAKLYNGGSYGIAASLLFLTSSLLNIYERATLNVPAAAILSYAILITVIQMRQGFGLLQFGTLIGFIISAISMWELGWNYYLFITPLLILGGLLSIHDESENQKVKLRYDLVSFEEQEDVLSKIERSLK